MKYLLSNCIFHTGLFYRVLSKLSTVMSVRSCLRNEANLYGNVRQSAFWQMTIDTVYYKSSAIPHSSPFTLLTRETKRGSRVQLRLLQSMFLKGAQKPEADERTSLHSFSKLIEPRIWKQGSYNLNLENKGEKISNIQSRFLPGFKSKNSNIK